MTNPLIVKIEIKKGPRPKQEFVTIHTHDRSIDMEKPLDESTQALLGNNFKGYFTAQLKDGRLSIINETSWTEWNKGRFL